MASNSSSSDTSFTSYNPLSQPNATIGTVNPTAVAKPGTYMGKPLTSDQWKDLYEATTDTGTGTGKGGKYRKSRRRRTRRSKTRRSRTRR
jgi:hypothetical protein